MQWAMQLITWVSTIIVARLLTPADYGLVGMAGLLMGLLAVLSEAGVGLAVVTLRELDRSRIAQINAVSVLMGVAGTLIAAAIAIPLARFFDAPNLTTVVVVMSLGFTISAFRVVPHALLQRDLQFRTLAVIDGLTALLQAATMVTLAFLGFRYWTLVIGGLLGIVFSTAAKYALRPHGFAWPHINEIAPALRFSWHVLVSRLAWFVYSRADFMVAGRVLGQAALGVYNFAWTLATMPVEKVTALVVRVTPSIFAAVQDDPPALRRYLLNLTEAMAIITFPMTFGLALVAPRFVPLVLGEQWFEMIVPLQVIALYASVRSISPLLSQILASLRKTRYKMWHSLAAVIVLPTAFYIGSRWGIVGIALAWVIAHPLILIPQYWYVFRVMKLPATAYVRCLWPAISAAAVMSGIVLLVIPATSDLPAPIALALQVGSGAVAYGAVLLLLHRQRLSAFMSVMRTIRAGGA